MVLVVVHSGTASLRSESRFLHNPFSFTMFHYTFFCMNARFVICLAQFLFSDCSDSNI